MSQPRVLIVSARLGGGHDGAARAIANHLQRHGAEVRIVDFLDAAPRLGAMLETVFRVEVERAPWAYRLEFELWSHVPALTKLARSVFRRAFGTTLRAWLETIDPDLVISTHPFPAQLLGEFRRRRNPCVANRHLVTFLTDFSVHPMWIHPSIDVHLAVSDSAAVQAKRRGHLAGPVVRVGPFVDERFWTLPKRASARRQLGLPPEARIALIVGGSWGVGKLVETAATLAATGDVVPVVLAGHNEELRARAEATGGIIAVGWTNEVDLWLAACDVVVQNAGGLSSLEAMAARRPVISYEPIVGHGAENVAAMAESGVTFWARSARELYDAVVHYASNPEELTLPALAQFQPNPEAPILELLTEAPPRPAASPQRVALRRGLIGVASAASVFVAANVTSGLIGYQGLNLSAAARPTHVAYLAALLPTQDLASPALDAALRKDHIAVVVTERGVRHDPAAVTIASAAGVALVNGGSGSRIGDLSFIVPVNDLQLGREALSAVLGSPVNVYVPQNTINAVDLAWAALHHQSVIPAHIVPPRALHSAIAPGSIVEVADPTASISTALALVASARRALAARHLVGAPISDLARAPELDA